jgi:hypothetical protein
MKCEGNKEEEEEEEEEKDDDDDIPSVALAALHVTGTE